jgi:hypothetical protein
MAAVPMLRMRHVLLLALLTVSPAAGEESMNASAAREFVADSMFSYSCFDGTDGAGLILADGSAVGSVRITGRGATRYLRLPPGTLYVRDDRICAKLNGLYFEPCFDLTRTSDKSFRGSVSGLGFMYCDFNRGGRTRLARRHGSKKVNVDFLAGATLRR